ncbi:GEVED domain-containing protein [Polaribacter pacificus]|nr:GEVED domain-containing protein [Polaribacter pacificus]
MPLNSSNLKLIILNLFLCLLLYNEASGQSYCTPSNMGGNAGYNITNVTFGTINNSSNSGANQYTYYNNASTFITQKETLALSITYQNTNYNNATLKVWIDYNRDGDFDDAGEEIITPVTYKSSNSSSGVVNTFQIVIPESASEGVTRMRVGINRSSGFTACNFSYQNGEAEDYVITIKPKAEPPVVNCVGSLSVRLDILGNAVITADQIDNGSTDAYDDSQGIPLNYSIDRSTFSCSDLNNTLPVTLTVTDSDGKSASCITNVTILPYDGTFNSPDLNDIEAYCAYTAAAPEMNYQCGQIITATTTDQTSFSTPSTDPDGYLITWTFDNGTTSTTSTQRVKIINPIAPTSLAISNVSENSATLSWSSTQSGDYRIRYRPVGTSTWTEITSTTKTKNITGLDDGIQYEVQVSIDASCTAYSSSITFTTIDVAYCNSQVYLSNSTDYYISNVSIGTINKTTTSSEPLYSYYTSPTTNLVIGETFSGTITYKRDDYNTTGLKVWLDFNNDGDFDDAGEEIYSKKTSGSTSTTIVETLSNIQVPQTATLGKTRMRVGVKHTGVPSSACNFNNQTGEIEDYDVYLVAANNTAYESAMITQVYMYGSEKWIEITNTNSTVTIPANTLHLGFFNNTSAFDQTGNTPTASYTIPSALSPKASILIKNSSSVLNNVQGTANTSSALTAFDSSNDILIISKKSDATAWENRFDVFTGFANKTSVVRKDNAITYNKNFSSSEWVTFVDNLLDPYADTPERHPHDPTVLDVLNASANSNVLLGYHRTNEAIRSGNAWTNGVPDRSRTVVINENYSQNYSLSARELVIESGNALTLIDAPIFVTDKINIKSGGSIRLSGNSQLVMTHTGASTIGTGSGLMYIDQDSDIASVYRFNYMSSPVVTSGTNTYNLLSVFKDGTIPTSTTSVPKNINFIGGYNGNYNNSPSQAISLAEHWIYIYDENAAGSADEKFVQVGKSGTIKPGKGYLFKGPGREQNYTFTGKPNDGDYTYTLPGLVDVLVGNPYPSAMDAKKFIRDNLSSTTGTLYFWQQAGEKESSGDEGHFSDGYVGGYATVNLSAAVPASGAEQEALNMFTNKFEAEDAELGGNAKKELGAVVFKAVNDSLTFEQIGISQAVDTLRIEYSSLFNDKGIDIYINNSLAKTVTLPKTVAYDTIDVLVNVPKNSDILLKSKDTVKTSFDKIFVDIYFSYNTPKEYIAVGQGFFIASDDDGGTLRFKNSQRENVIKGDESFFFKGSSKAISAKQAKSNRGAPLKILKLGMDYLTANNLKFHRQIAISFKSGNSFAHENGYDSEMYDLSTTDMSWKFPESNLNYVIAGVQDVSLDLEIPLELTTDVLKDITIKIDELENLDFDIYLNDKLSNTLYNLSEAPAKFQLNAGTFTDRFVITFKNKTLDVEDVYLENNTQVYFDGISKELVIKNKGNTQLQKVELYSILGQKVSQWELQDGTDEQRFKIQKLPTSIYIVKLQSSNGQFSKKIVVY